MGWQPERDGESGVAPDSDPVLPGEPPRDPRLPGFVKDGEWDACPPSAALAEALEGASAAQWRCPGASRDEMLGLLRQWQAMEAWAAAGKLGVLRALIRDDDQPLPGGGYQGDLPEGWTKSLTHEVALALAMPAVSAEPLMWTAWNLQAMLPGTGALLAAGQLTLAKARAVEQALSQLTTDDAAAAEAMIIQDLPGKTYGQAQRLAVQAAITVDPDSATRRRKHAEQDQCRVTMFREESGAAALSGRDLPTDQTLAAHASVCARAEEYKESGTFPDDTRMDQFRATAYLDLLNEIPAETRIASARLTTATSDGQPPDAANSPNPDAGDEPPATDAPPDRWEPDTPEPGLSEPDAPKPDTSEPGLSEPDAPEPDTPEPGPSEPEEPDAGACDSGPRCPGPRPSPGSPGLGADDTKKDGPDGPDLRHGHPGPVADGRLGSDQGSSPAGSAVTPQRLHNLVIPLVTLLGLAERPGEGHGLGPLDPDLCRSLASSATGSPWTQWCVTVTDSDGIAIGHGCARTARTARTPNHSTSFGAASAPADITRSLSARVNLTIPATRLAGLAARPAGPPAPWRFTGADDPGPPDGFGTWTVTLPDGRTLTVRLGPVPTAACDHRHESRAYQPNATLRHLVQVRDYECTFPTCSRHARESDFEHAIPYDQGGRTCACNAGARSRACHQVKQSPGWTVTQPRPGWHQWQTPAGRTYTQGPKRYPA